MKGFEGLYEISGAGVVKSMPRLVATSKKPGSHRFLTKERFLKPGLASMGYLTVSIYNRTYYVHRLVAEAHMGGVLGKKEVNHINGIKTDNRLENLEWCTHGENIKHAYAIGLNYSNPNLGEAVKTSKLKNFQVRRIKLALQLGTSCTRLGKIFRVDRTTIGLIKNNKHWKSISM